jgi:hypothetical protein
LYGREIGHVQGVCGDEIQLAARFIDIEAGQLPECILLAKRGLELANECTLSIYLYDPSL